MRLAIFSSISVIPFLLVRSWGGAPKFGLRVVKQLTRALLALAREVLAVEEGILFARTRSVPAPAGRSSSVASETEIRLPSRCIS